MDNFEFPFHAIADTHWFHFNLTKDSYASRPVDHDELMIKYWNRWVRDDDVVLHLGDLAMGKKEWFMDVAQQLKGKKYLIKGNHDTRSNEWYAEHGFEVIPPFEMEYKGYKIFFTHHPKSKLYPRQINCHGHVHGNYVDCLTTAHIGFSVEMRYFRPMPVQSLVDNTIYRLENKIKDCK